MGIMTVIHIITVCVKYYNPMPGAGGIFVVKGYDKDE